MGIEIFKKHLREKRAIKVSVGHRDTEHAAKIARACQQAKASAIDIPFSKEIYDVVKKNSRLPILVTSYHPFELLEAVKMGVDGVIIGNYWDLYKRGKYFNAQEVYDVILETLGLISDYNVFTCVTIPTTLELNEQLDLIKKLEYLGVDLIQVEGYKQTTAYNIIPSSFDAIAIMSECMKYTRIPMMASSDINVKTAFAAFEAGASAVAAENVIYDLSSEVVMKSTIMEIVASVAYRNSLNREIIRTAR